MAFKTGKKAEGSLKVVRERLSEQDYMFLVNFYNATFTKFTITCGATNRFHIVFNGFVGEFVTFATLSYHSQKWKVVFCPRLQKIALCPLVDGVFFVDGGPIFECGDNGAILDAIDFVHSFVY